MPADQENGNGNSTQTWAMYQKLVVSELERLDKNSNDLYTKLDDLDTALRKEIADINIKVAILQTKAAALGALGGAALTGLIEFFLHLSK
jgi:hypothetical protein